MAMKAAKDLGQGFVGLRLWECRGAAVVFPQLKHIKTIYIYMLPPPEKSTVFMGVVRANSRKIFEVEDKFSQNNYF